MSPGLVKLPRLHRLDLLGHAGCPEHPGEGDHEDKQLNQGQVELTSDLTSRTAFIDTNDIPPLTSVIGMSHVSRIEMTTTRAWRPNPRYGG